MAYGSIDPVNENKKGGINMLNLVTNPLANPEPIKSTLALAPINSIKKKCLQWTLIYYKHWSFFAL